MKILITLMLLCMCNLIVHAQVEPTKKLSSQSRSAKTGQYVTKSYANKHPSTTCTSKKK